MTTIVLPSPPPGTNVAPVDSWGVFPFHQDVRMGMSAAPLFTTTRATGSSFFDAQNAKIALERATGRRFYVDQFRTYERVQA